MDDENKSSTSQALLAALAVVFVILLLLGFVINHYRIGGSGKPFLRIHYGKVVATGQCTQTRCAYSVQDANGFMYYITSSEPRAINQRVAIKEYDCDGKTCYITE